MEAGNVKAMREALVQTHQWLVMLFECGDKDDSAIDRIMSKLQHCRNVCAAALAKPPYTGKWKNGKKYEYEYAYCSECGRMQWAGWDSHNQAQENIEDFADNYRFCPGCGAKMEGGVYVK